MILMSLRNVTFKKKGVIEMFDKPVTEMTLEEIDHAEEINFAYFLYT